MLLSKIGPAAARRLLGEGAILVDIREAAASGSIVGFSLGLVGVGCSIVAVPLLVYVVGLHDPHLAP